MSDGGLTEPNTRLETWVKDMRQLVTLLDNEPDTYCVIRNAVGNLMIVDPTDRSLIGYINVLDPAESDLHAYIE